MPLLAQLCVLVVTIAVVLLAVMAIRLMLRTQVLIESATRSMAELPALIEEAKRMSARADDLLLAFSKITHSVHSGATQLEGLTSRSLSMSHRLLDEIEHPLSRAVGVMRGLRTGADLLIRTWQSRFNGATRSRVTSEPAADGRWSDDGGRRDPAGHE